MLTLPFTLHSGVGYSCVLEHSGVGYSCVLEHSGAGYSCVLEHSGGGYRCVLEHSGVGYSCVLEHNYSVAVYCWVGEGTGGLAAPGSSVEGKVNSLTKNMILGTLKILNY
jgi:hypothetical protein